MIHSNVACAAILIINLGRICNSSGKWFLPLKEHIWGTGSTRALLTPLLHWRESLRSVINTGADTSPSLLSIHPLQTTKQQPFSSFWATEGHVYLFATNLTINQFRDDVWLPYFNTGISSTCTAHPKSYPSNNMRWTMEFSLDLIPNFSLCSSNVNTNTTTTTTTTTTNNNNNNNNNNSTAYGTHRFNAAFTKALQ